MKALLLAPFIALLVVACNDTDIKVDSASPSLTQTKPSYDHIAELAADLQCDSDAQCKAVATGKKGCGGPTGYLVYSTKMMDESLFLAAVADYNNSIILDPNAVSNCMMMVEPATACKAEKCINLGFAAELM